LIVRLSSPVLEVRPLLRSRHLLERRPIIFVVRLLEDRLERIESALLVLGRLAFGLEASIVPMRVTDARSRDGESPAGILQLLAFLGQFLLGHFARELDVGNLVIGAEEIRRHLAATRHVGLDPHELDQHAGLGVDLEDFLHVIVVEIVTEAVLEIGAKLCQRLILRLVTVGQGEGLCRHGLNLALAPGVTDVRRQVPKCQGLVDLTFRHAIDAGDLLAGFATAIAEPRERLILIDRMQLLGCHSGRQRILESAGLVDVAQRAADRLARFGAIDHVERRQAPVAVADGIETGSAGLDDEVLDLAAGVNVRGELGNAVITAGDAGIDAGAVFLAELQSIERDFEIHVLASG
jgi:hypothetical protein